VKISCILMALEWLMVIACHHLVVSRDALITQCKVCPAVIEVIHTKRRSFSLTCYLE